MIGKYAELLNLLDIKEVFSYKTSSNQSQIQTNSVPFIQLPTTQSTSNHFMTGSTTPNQKPITTARDNLDDPIWLFYKFKSSFYELVYKFPYAHLLKVLYFIQII